MTGETRPLKTPSRRWFLIGGSAAAVTGLSIGALVLNAEHESPTEHQRAVQKQQETAKAERFAKLFSVGIADSWIDAVVWPGLAIIPSSVPLYRTPKFDDKSQIPWGPADNSKHLIAQRPFLAKTTAAFNNLPGYENVDDQTLAFWLPDSNDLAFCDLAAHADSILLPTHSKEKIYKGDSLKAIVGEFVNLETPLHQDKLVWRYLNAERSPGHDDPVRIMNKVCGRSELASPGGSSEAYHTFVENQGPDIIKLPKKF